MSIKNKHREKNEYLINGNMEAGHLMEDAEIWWNSRAKEMLESRNFSNEFSEQQAALDATNPLHPNYIGGRSGILNGVPWFMLTPLEHRRVLLAYTMEIAVKQ